MLLCGLQCTRIPQLIFSSVVAWHANVFCVLSGKESQPNQDCCATKELYKAYLKFAPVMTFIVLSL